MKISTLFGRTLRETPSEADHPAHQLVLRAALVRAMRGGSYALLPLGMRVAERIEQIMHEEMRHIGGQPFRTPVVQSAEPWQRSGRYAAYGPSMLRLEDRGGHPLIVAPTHEEAVTELARSEIASYRDLPLLLYQIHTKYRDEARARGGLLRMREFTMLDGYSMDHSWEGLDAIYDQVASAFERIFARCGVRFVSVEAASGEMGGSESREYVALAGVGEDLLALCDGCGYSANLEVARRAAPSPAEQSGVPEREPVATPDCRTIAELAALLDIPEEATAKAVFFDTPERGLLFAVVRGDLEVNEEKLRAVAGVSALHPASDEQIRAVGAVPGYASPIGLSEVSVIADISIAAAGGLVAGANEEGMHLRHVLHGRDWQADSVEDIATAREGDSCTICGELLGVARGIEVGHVFKLGTRFSEALDATFLDETGEAQPIIMGSYGIGVERLLQVIVEQHHDEQGIHWPLDVAPFDLYLLHLGKEEEVKEAGDTLYRDLHRAGMRVLYDDRDERAGVKFNDADLLGIPLRIVTSRRHIQQEQVEIKARRGEVEIVPRDALLHTLKARLAGIASEERIQAQE